MPTSRHCEQYGRLRSHLTFRFEQVKQSSAAPPAGVRRLRFRTAAAEAAAAATSTALGGWTFKGTVIVSDVEQRDAIKVKGINEESYIGAKEDSTTRT